REASAHERRARQGGRREAAVEDRQGSGQRAQLADEGTAHGAVREALRADQPEHRDRRGDPADSRRRQPDAPRVQGVPSLHRARAVPPRNRQVRGQHGARATRTVRLRSGSKVAMTSRGPASIPIAGMLYVSVAGAISLHAAQDATTPPTSLANALPPDADGEYIFKNNC